MSNEPVKSWKRPWSVQEIIDNASNWSLAGDAGLLKYLETFSETLLTKAEETNNNLNKLLEGLDKASLSLDIVKNEFSSLHNTQFIENRVYEDDETLAAAENAQENVDDKKSADEEKLKDMKEAVMRGINVVEKYFEKVEVPGSDTEDEADFPSFVLRPKDPYLDRPLPYVIGSEEWYKKWHVGLLDSSSDSEADKVSEKFSESDSEDDLPVQDRSWVKGISNSESEADMSNRMIINKPVANSTFDESVKQPDLFGSSDSEDYNSVPAHVPISTRSFAQELAAKLGNVEQNTQIIEPEVNRRPIQTGPPIKTIGNLFSDEPPPIDEEDDELFGNNSAQQGLFSGGGGLFDDLDGDDNLWKDKATKPKTPSKALKSNLPNLFDDEDEDIFSGTASQIEGNRKTSDVQNTKPKKIVDDLFNDDDDIFKENHTEASIKPYLPSIKKTKMPYIDHEPPELEPKVASTSKTDFKEKKPVGGVKIFGGADLFGQQTIGDILKNKRQDSSESSDGENVNIIKNLKEPPPKTIDDAKDLFEEFHASNITKQQENKLIEQKAEDKSLQKDDQFNQTEVRSEKKPNKVSLFDDEDTTLFEDDLFSNMSSKKFTSSLFNEDSLDDIFAKPVIEKSNSKEDKLSFDDVKESPSEVSVNETVIGKLSVNNDDVSSAEQVQKKPEKPKSLSLFDDNVDIDETDDIFATKPSRGLVVGLNKEENLDIFDTQKSDNSFTSSTAQGVSKSTESNVPTSTHSALSINFFDQNPPELDDDWDTKSENNLFEDNDDAGLFDNTPEISSRRSGLFDNEPPSLFSESSGIVRDVSARAETDDSFNPYASSSRRFSTDIFNEQQSSDSFFVTKNKSESDIQNVHSNLDIIPEISNMQVNVSSQSNLEITPSGNIDDLFDDTTVSASGSSVFEQDKTKEDYTQPEIQDNKADVIVKQNSSENYDLFADANNLVQPEKRNDKNVDLIGAQKDDDSLFNEPSSLSTDLFGIMEKAIESNTSVETEGETKATTDSEAVKPEIRTAKPLIARKTIKVSTSDPSIADDPTKADDAFIAKIGSPGKLKHNLNINVKALMPGISPPKRKGLEKSHSFEVTSSYEDDLFQSPTKSDRTLIEQSENAGKVSEREESRKSIEKSLSFDNPLNVAEVLPSITKDRVRIPVKRRPSTRKARHQSIRNSVPDFKINMSTEDKEIKIEEKSQISEAVPNVKKSTEIAKQEEQISKQNTSTFEDLFGESPKDLFPSKTLDVTEADVSKVPTKTEGNKSKNIFLSDSPDSDDLFGEHQNPMITVEPSKSTNDEIQKDDDIKEHSKSSIFGGQRRSVINSDSFESADFKNADLFEESEDFDDIFSSKKLPPKSNILKKSLFDDELDDDDIFGPPVASTSKNTSGSKPPEKKAPKTSQVKRLENSEAVEDPLSSFMED